MRKSFSVFLSFLFFVSTIFGFIGCATEAKEESTSGVTINFNGGSLHGKVAKFLDSESIAHVVGMPIFDALTELDFGVDLLERNGFYLTGWTKTKNGEDYISRFPTFGTIYAKWVETVNVTFNLNGGYAYNYDGNLQREKITYDIPKDKYLDFFAPIVPQKEGYTFIGWTKTKNGTDAISQAKENCPTVYARWQENIKAFDYGDIAGEFAPEGAALTKQGEGVYTYEFIYSEDMNSWGSTNGSVKFKIRTVANDWFVSYGCSENSYLVIDYYSAKLIPTHDGNAEDITLSGLEDGITYTIRIECTEDGYFSVNAYTGGDVLDLGGDGSLTFTLDAGNAYFWRENYAEGKVEGPKRLIYKFTPGTSLAQIINDIETNYGYSISALLYTEYNHDLKSNYLYEDAGWYYTWNNELKDKTGSIISLADDTKLNELTLSRNTVYTLLPCKLVSVTFDFNGGKYNYTSGRKEVLIEGDSLDYSWMDDIYKSGSVFMGWKDGSDAFVTTVPSVDSTLYAVWGHTLTINASSCDFRNTENSNLVKSITHKFISGTNIQDVWNDIFTFVDGQAQFTVEDGVFVINKYDEANNIYYESNGMYYGLTGIYDSNSNKLIDENFVINTAYSSEQLTSNTTLSFKYDRLYQVTFDLNGGSYNNSTEAVKEYKFQNQKIKSFKPTMEGYKFLGWTKTLDGEDFVEELSVQEDTTVYAKWKDLSICELYLRSGDSGYFGYDDNVTDQIVLSFKIGDRVCDVEGYVEPTARLETLGKYVFIGYADDDGNMISSDTELREFTILNAVYEYRRLISVTFDAKGGKFHLSEGTLSEESIITVDVYEKEDVSHLPGYLYYTPYKEGQQFIGWYDANTGERVSTHSYEHTSLIAKWSCLLTIDAGAGRFVRTSDGYTVNQIEYTFESGMYVEQIVNNIFRNEDGHQYFSVDSGEYEFYKDENNIYYFHYDEDDVPYGFRCCSDITNNGQTIFDSYFNVVNLWSTLESDTTWAMEYERLYSVTYDLNGGIYNGSTDCIVEFAFQYETYSYNQYCPAIKEGYKFLGWTYTKDGEDYLKIYETVPEDITVYAKWRNLSECILVLDTWGYFGTYTNEEGDLVYVRKLEIPFTKGDTFADIQDNYYAEKPKYPMFPMYNNGLDDGRETEFAWYIDEDGNTVTPETVFTQYTILSDVVREGYPATFDLNGGNINGDTSNFTELIDVGHWLNLYEKPTKEGYTFIGWTLTKDGDDFINQVTEPIPNIVYAKWQDPRMLFEYGDVIGDFSVSKGELKDGTIGWVYDDSKTLSLTYEGEGVYSTTFTYYDYMCGWDGGNGTCSFKIRTSAGTWEGDNYGIADDQPVVDGVECLCYSNYGNIVVSLQDGVTYKIIFRCAEDGNVYVKVETVK